MNGYELDNPKRSAHASFAGYLYQALVGVERWLGLKENEVLLCEGNEDLDRLMIDGGGITAVTAEQIKHYAKPLRAHDRAVKESVRNFLVAYVKGLKQGETRDFIFTTTAKQRVTGDPDRDLLQSWKEGGKPAEVAAAIQELLKDETEAVEPMAYLTARKGGWSGFLRSVEWRFGAPDAAGVRQRIVRMLSEQGKKGIAEILADRLLVAVFGASARPIVEFRMLTRADLEKTLALTETQLLEWAKTQQARNVQELLAPFRQAVREELKAHAAEQKEAGAEALLHDGIERAPTAELTPTILLRAGSKHALKFYGRDEEEATLTAWWESADRVGVRLLTGEGGCGKTRLLLEMVTHLRGQGSRAGFLKRDVEPQTLGEVFAGDGKKLLLVVDYAENKRELVETLLTHIAQGADGFPPVCLALLARNAGEWWDTLCKGCTPPVDEILRRPDTVAGLRPLASTPEKKRALYEKALAHFRALLPSKGATASQPDLTPDHFGHPLFLQMAALAALDGKTVSSADDLLDATLAHEERYWSKNLEARLQPCRQAAKGAVAPLMALVTLHDGVDEAACRELAARAFPKLREDERDELVALLVGFYGTGDADATRIAPLQPDILGERLVERELEKSASRGGKNWLLDLAFEPGDADTLVHALTVLTRRANANPPAKKWLREALCGRLDQLVAPAMKTALETGDPIGQVLAEVVEAEAKPALAEELVDVLDKEFQQTVVFRELAVVATTKVLAFKKSDWPQPNKEQLAELARLSSHLGNRFSDVGRREEALAAAQEATDKFGQLATTRPDEFLQDFATSLNNLGKCMSELGHREEALAAVQESVKIHRQLAASRPDAFLPNLAMSLNNLGGFLSELGRREEALPAAREAVEIRRHLAARQPDAFLPDLAMSLTNLSLRLSELGHGKEASAVAKEAVEIRRRLAASRPDAFLPALAMSLNNLGKCLAELGQCKEALPMTQEAAEIYRKLAASHPDTFLANLAMSLNNLGGILSNLGQRDEASAAAREATGIYRQLAETCPNAFLPHLAMSLTNLCSRLAELGQCAEALALAQETVEIRRRLAANRPDAFLPYLASSLNNLGFCLSEAGLAEDAHKAYKEAVQTLRPFFVHLPAAFGQWMMNMLRNYLESTQALGRAPDAELIGPILEVLEKMKKGEE